MILRHWLARELERLADVPIDDLLSAEKLDELAELAERLVIEKQARARAQKQAESSSASSSFPTATSPTPT